MEFIKISSQIINGIGTLVNIIGINTKDKRKTLLHFIIGNILITIALALLNATTGMIIQTIFVFETIINFFWEKKNKKYPLWLILIYIMIPCIVLIINYKTIYDILPIIAGIFFPLAVISKNFLLRLFNLLAVIVWIPYNFYYEQYVGAISCIVFTITNIIAIIRFDILKQKKRT